MDSVDVRLILLLLRALQRSVSDLQTKSVAQTPKPLISLFVTAVVTYCTSCLPVVYFVPCVATWSSGGAPSSGTILHVEDTSVDTGVLGVVAMRRVGWRKAGETSETGDDDRTVPTDGV